MYTRCLKRNQYSTNSIYRYNYYSVSATAFFSPKLENIFFILPTDTKSIIKFQWLFLENVPHNCPLVSISSATFLIYLPYFIFSDFVLGNQILFLKTCFLAPLFKTNKLSSVAPHFTPNKAQMLLFRVLTFILC